jgi:hypothetical protein
MPTLNEFKLELLKLDHETAKDNNEIKLLSKKIANAHKRQMAYLRSLTIAELHQHIDLLLAEAAKNDDKSVYDIAIDLARTQLEQRTRQEEQQRVKRQKRAGYRFEPEYRKLYSIADMPDGEWFELDKHGNPASNAKNIALALKRLEKCEITFDEFGNCSIVYSNYPIRLENAPIFFSHVIRDAFKFIPRRDQFPRALRLLRG